MQLFFFSLRMGDFDALFFLDAVISAHYFWGFGSIVGRRSGNFDDSYPYADGCSLWLCSTVYRCLAWAVYIRCLWLSRFMMLSQSSWQYRERAGCFVGNARLSSCAMSRVMQAGVVRIILVSIDREVQSIWPSLYGFGDGDFMWQVFGFHAGFVGKP